MLMTVKPNPKKDSAIARIEAACRLLEAQEKTTLAELAQQVGLSPWHFQRLFQRVVGVSPRAFADAKRSERFRGELKRGESVAGATYGAGYGSSSRVYENVQRRFGMTPASYAKGGKGAAIAYAIADSPLGRLLVATTAQGVCFVALGRDDRETEQALRAEFPAADRLERDEARLAPALESVVAFLEGKRPHAALPLDVQATAFQRRVWQELLAIPVGETRSYSDIAAALDLPKAQRAVGSACARNPVALLIPCHRVTRDDGALGGYRWGLARKKQLLDVEATRGRPL